MPFSGSEFDAGIEVVSDDKSMGLDSIVIFDQYRNALPHHDVHYWPGRIMGSTVVEPLISHGDCEVGRCGSVLRVE